MKETKSKQTPKLIPHLQKHENYVLHYRNLQYIVKLGVKVTLKRTISFSQKPWMKEYILENNERRAEAKKNKDEFLSDFSS